MKHLLLVLVLVSISTFAMATTEYKLTRVQYTASDGVRYDTARRNLSVYGSQMVINGNTFELKFEMVNGNYLNGDRDVYEQYQFTPAGGNRLNLVDSNGRRSMVTILRYQPLRLKFDDGAIYNFRQVGVTGWDRNPGIRKIQSVSEAIEHVVNNEREIGQIGF